MKLLLVAAFLQTCACFTVLPYIQIDFAHFFRLAQCQAKCTEKYGVISKRTLNDGSVEEVFNSTSEEGKFCEMGCQQHRRAKKMQRSVKNAVQDGTRFWQESSADSAKIGSSPVSKIELLCQNPAMSEGDFEDSIEGLIALSMKRNSGPVRFVVQWKQRTFALGFYDESQWITASIESDSLFSVEGMVPGVQYRFMVTVVGPNGRLGNPAMSDWVEAVVLPTSVRGPAGPISTKNGFNTEHGVTSLLNWGRTPQDSCTYRINISNATHHVTNDFKMDASGSLLLKHLDFDSAYKVEMAALGSRPGEPSHPRLSKPISSEFVSFSCNQVYGKGSLNCAPQSVDNFRVVLLQNGTALLSWAAPTDVENILTYQVQYQSLTMDSQCETQPTNIYLKGETTKAELLIRGSHSCEYVIRLINYDLIGREAFTEARVVYAPSIAVMFLDWQILLIAGSVVCIILLCIVLKCSMSSKCKSKISEKQAKLVDYA